MHVLGHDPVVSELTVEAGRGPDLIARVLLYLLANEPANNLLVSLVSAVQAQPDSIAYLGAALADGQIQGVAYQNAVQVTLSTALDAVAGAALAQDMYHRGCDVLRLTGPTNMADSFAQQWREVGFGSAVEARRMRIFSLDRVKLARPVSGRLRHASQDDRPLLIDWWQAFGRDIGDSPITRDEAASEVDAHLRNQSLYVWEDSQVTSMTRTTGATPNGIRLTQVYTPPHLRGRDMQGPASRP